MDFAARREKIQKAVTQTVRENERQEELSEESIRHAYFYALAVRADCASQCAQLMVRAPNSSRCLLETDRFTVTWSTIIIHWRTSTPPEYGNSPVIHTSSSYYSSSTVSRVPQGRQGQYVEIH